MYAFLTLSSIFNVITFIAAGTIIYRKNKKGTINKAFAIYCFFLTFWALGYFWPISPESREVVLLSERILHMGALFIAVANLHFKCTLLGIEKDKKYVIFFGYIFNLIILPFVWTDLFIIDAVPTPPLAYYPQVGILYSVWLSVWIGYLIYSLYLMYSHYGRLEGIRKYQIKYIMIGDVVATVFGATNFMLLYRIPIPPYLMILSSFHIWMVFYLIARYRFLNIQVSIINIFRKVIAFLMALVVGYTVNFVLWPIADKVSVVDVLVRFGSIILTYLSVCYILKFPLFYRFFRITSLEHFKKTLDKFKSKGAFYSNMDSLQKEVRVVFKRSLHISSVNLLSFTDSKGCQYPNLCKHFYSQNKPLVAEELSQKQHDSNVKYPYFKELKSLGEICFPLYRQNKLVGFFALGFKPYKNPYSAEEIEILTTVAFDINLSFNVLQYNKSLREEVARKTSKLRESNRKLKELDKAKDSFLSIASHELRTPMTAINGYIDLMLSGEFGKLQGQQKQFMGRIHRRTNELLSLINDMLDVSRLEANRMQFNFADVKICPLMKDIIMDYEAICDEKGIEITLDNPDNFKGKMRTDPEKIKVLFNNLIGNAYKFTPEKGKITVRCRKPKDQPGFLQFEVQDTGIGIAKSQQKAVFEKFRQVENYLQKTQKGTGLGLSIVKGIIDKLGGKIWVEGEEGKGSNFIFLLPLKSPKIK